MTEARYRFKTIPVIPIVVPQGVTYFQRWMMRFKSTGEPFPFFSEIGDPLWKGRCMFRVDYADAAPVLSLTTEAGGVILDYVDDPGPPALRTVYYSLMVSAAQAAALPPGKILYDVEFERLSDGWVIRTQRGRVTTGAEATK